MTIHLPKWPALVVVGDPVTREQAEEIIIRTNRWSGTFSHNETAWRHQILDTLKIPYDVERPSYAQVSYEDCVAFTTGIGALDLDYLNNSRISTSYIGGPHGWCNWDGAIFTSNYNIGKWPSATHVRNEWQLIAETFPFLKLKCQLFSDEACNGGGTPLVQYSVNKGKVRMTTPKKPLVAVSPRSEVLVVSDILQHLYRDPSMTRGCRLDVLKSAVERLQA